MVLLMFRGDRIAELPDCTDVIHKEGAVVCLNSAGKPIARFADADLVYYTLNRECIQTIHQLNLGLNEKAVGMQEPKPLPESVLGRLWRKRKARELKTRSRSTARNNDRRASL